LLAATCFSELKPYRGGQIVKHFRMSPWTTALSHTLASGFFHTDINTAPLPPAATVMQCLERDPGAPAFGQLRVARAADLLRTLASSGRREVLRFLTEDRVTMVNETSPQGWSGILVDGHTIRFHPESLQAACNQGLPNPADLQAYLDAVHESALAVSDPIDLAPGEVLFVSNRRALHQRGACTVRFREYPRRFDARRVSVFHALDEPS
jgi:alpha-ketoglutarate-dependent taurine dioxygenase